MTLTCRKSLIRQVFVNSNSQASLLQFGDSSGTTTLFNRAIAVQRAIANSRKDEARFASYPLFDLPNPVPVDPPDTRMNAYSDGSPIRVGDISIIAISNSGLVRFGCGGPLYGEARIVNVRQYNGTQRPYEK